MTFTKYTNNCNSADEYKFSKLTKHKKFNI